MDWDGTRYLVNGQPLTFFHFSGFDGKRPYLLSKHQGDRPRILLSERPGVARICREYLGDLERRRAVEHLGALLRLGDAAVGAAVRSPDAPARIAPGSMPPSRAAPPSRRSPFADGGEPRFIEWLNEPVAGGLAQDGVALPVRHLSGPARSAARVSRSRAIATTVGAIFEWVRRDGIGQHNIPPALLPPDPASAG